MAFYSLVIYFTVSLFLSGSTVISTEIMDWQSYKAAFGKIYVNSVSEAIHKQNFIRNLKTVESHNANFENGIVTYTLGLNQFSDMDPKTFSAIMNGYKPLNETRVNSISNSNITVTSITPLEANFDWRDQNKVSPVKNQGQCGSCWAFSAAGALESQLLIKEESSTTLSEEQLVDCDKGNGACEGGHYLNAWNYIKKSGIQSDADYPYTAKNGRVGRCKYAKSKVVTRVSDFQRVPNDAEQIMETLRTIGPLSAAMDASKLQQYRSGVFKCSNPRLNHAVLIVGYTDEYWIIKNSWGANWGENGYVKISKDPQRDCGITKDVAYASI